MGLYVPSAGGMIHSDVEDLVRLLQQGDGMGWPGDPRMWIQIGTLKRRAQGKLRIGRRYEVWRLNEEGEEVMIAHWRLDEKDRILYDLARMRLDSPGHVDTIEQIDANNERVEAENTARALDAMGEAMEHGAKLLHDTTEGRNVFRGMPGLRDA